MLPGLRVGDLIIEEGEEVGFVHFVSEGAGGDWAGGPGGDRKRVRLSRQTPAHLVCQDELCMQSQHGEKADMGGRLAYSDAMDAVCLRTVSMEWKMPEKYGPHGVLLFFLIQKKPAIVPNSEAFNSYIGDGFQVPELKGESEASKDEQADSSSENNVCNGALFVIGLHGSGDVIAHFLQDWEVAKVALSCQKALDIGCAAGSASDVLFLAITRRKRMTCPS